MLFLGHGAAHQIGTSQRIAAEIAENLHDLLLINDTAVGHVQNRLQQRVPVRHPFRVMPVFDVARNRIHRAGAKQRDDRDEVLKVIRLELRQHALHAGGFKLKHTVAVALRQHSVNRRLIQRNRLDIKRRVRRLADHTTGVVNDRQVSQTQKIHFEKPQLLQRRHGILRRHRIAVEAQRHILRNRIGGNDDSGGMSRSVARHTLHLFRHIDQSPDLIVGIVQLLQAMRLRQCLIQRHIQLPRHLLCHRVAHRIRQAERPCHVTNGGPRRQRTEGHDLRHVIGTVPANDILDDLLTLFVAKINIKVRHADAFGVEEPLKQQLIPDRIDPGNTDAIRTQTAGAGASSRTDRYVVLARILHKIVDNEIIIHVPHPLDGFHFVFQPPNRRRIGRVPIPALQALVAQPTEIRRAVAAGRIKVRQLGVSKLQLHTASLGNARRVVNRFGTLRKHRAHFFFGFYIKFVGFKRHRVRLVHRGICLNTQQHLLHFRIGARQIMGIVGAHQRDSRFTRQAKQTAVDRLLFGKSVILQLQKEVLFSEQIAVFQRQPSRPFQIALPKRRRDFTRQARRQRD